MITGAASAQPLHVISVTGNTIALSVCGDRVRPEIVTPLILPTELVAPQKAMILRVELAKFHHENRLQIHVHLIYQVQAQVGRLPQHLGRGKDHLIRGRCPQNITTLIFGGQKCTEESAQVALTLWDQSNQPVQLHLWTRQTIITVPPMKNLEDPDSSPADKEDQVDVLIGIDYYWRILGLHENEQLPSGLVLSHTRFGPVLSGLTDLTPPNVTSLVACSSSNIKDSGDSGSDQLARSLLGPGTVGSQHPASALVDAQTIEQVHTVFRVISSVCVTSSLSDHPPLADDKVLTFWTFGQQLQTVVVTDATVQRAINPNACKEVAWPHSTASLGFHFCLDLFSNIYSKQIGSLMSTCYEDLCELFHHFWDLWREHQPAAFAEMNGSSSRRQVVRTQSRFGEIALLRPRDVSRSLWPDLIFLLFSKDGFLLSVSSRSGKKNRSVDQLNSLAVVIVDVFARASVRQGFLGQHH
ncbi:hypothetical protein Aduo_005368 [Ancylostoma duodenale]